VKTSLGILAYPEAKRLFGRPRTCDRHVDCDAADELARERGFLVADHCHDDSCEDCFGC
jgi:hypothetical protein